MTPPPWLQPGPLTGLHLIEASAGTGKTRAITDLFVRLLVVEKRQAGEILVVTFTEAATKELRTRIRKRLAEGLAVLDGSCRDETMETLFTAAGDSNQTRSCLQAALAGFDEAAVFTIHGFCRKILREHSFEAALPFDTELIADSSTLLQEAVDDFWRRLTAAATPLFLRFLLEQRQERDRQLQGPDLLADFARQVLSRPDPILLSAPPDGSVERRESTVAALFDQLRRLWQEQRPRIEQLLGDEGLNRRSYPRDQIGAWMAGGDAFFLSGDPLFAWEHLDRCTQERLDGALKKGAARVTHPFFDCCSRFSRQRQLLLDDFHLHWSQVREQLLHYLRAELPRRKEQFRVRAFDDLLRDLRQALSGPGSTLPAAIRAKFPAALIDEFQDTDPIQYRIFRSIYDAPNSLLFIIGDPKQAIYSFRGADIFTYMNAGRDAVRFPLSVNWRSAPALIRAFNALFRDHRNPFLFEAIRFHEAVPAAPDEAEVLQFSGAPLENPLRLWFFPREEGEKEIPRTRADDFVPKAVGNEILRLLEAGREGKAKLTAVRTTPMAAARRGPDRPLEAADIAVIVRTNREARLIRDALASLGLPAVIHGDESLFASPEAGDVLQLLQAVAEPGEETLVRAALATPLFGLSIRHFQELQNDEAGWEQWLACFNEWHQLWLQDGLLAMASDLMSRHRVRERLLTLPDGERRLTNLIHCWELLHRVSEERHLGMKALLKWFARQRSERPQQEEYQLRLETDDKAIQVLTIHRSKGLEYPVVFAPYCWLGAGSRELVFFHDPEAGQALTLDLGSDALEAHRRAMAAEELAENMRLLYVAVTRAKHLCYLAWGAFRGAAGSGVAYLFHGRCAKDPLAAPFSIDFNTLDDAALAAEMRSLATVPQSGVSWVEPPVTVPTGRWRRFEENGEPLVLAPGPDQFPPPWRIGSFSAWVAPHRGSEGDLEFEPVAPIPTTGPLKAIHGMAPGIADFPRGPRAGLCLHRILERIDFQSRPEQWDSIIGDALRSYRFEEGPWLEVVRATLKRLLSAPLPGRNGTFSLAEIGRASRLTEMGFFFPVQRGDGADLAGVLSFTPRSRTFADRLKRLPENIRQGFMKGFIDLVFRHQERYFIVDWKSNHLGPSPDDYHPQRLEEAIAEEYYFLQYYLYTLALHKYLRVRIPDYDYDRHFGGVFYLFLRGFADGAAPSSGIFHDRPPLPAVRALEQAFSAGAKELEP
ncbi:MAG: exodeoxyribonuclease V subunit beta [Deltaproteobacteria bacterium]|nr:exodeoxyribonuclease V subunit beta [Deltaproteobacteria bacterium]